MNIDQVRLSEFGDLYPACPKPESILELCPLFDSINPSNLEFLVLQSHLAYADRNEILWSERTPSRFFIIVGDGILKISHHGLNKQEITIDALGPGSFGGLHLSEADSCFVSSATSVSSFWYLKIPNDVWHKVAKLEPILNERLWNLVVKKMQSRLDLILGLLLGDEEQRIGLILLRLASQFPDKGPGRKATIPLTSLALAELSGTNIDITKSVIKSWRKEGLLHVGMRGIMVNMPDELSDEIHCRSAEMSL